MALTPWKKRLHRKAKHTEKEGRDRRYSPWRRLYLERLEERLAPTTSPLIYNFGTGATDPTAVTLQLDVSGNLEITNDANSAVLMSQLLSNTSAVQVTGASGKNDQLTVNFSSGDFFSTSGTFSGGISFTGTSGDTDTLVVKGSGMTSSGTSASYAPDGGTAGNGSMTVTTPAADPITSIGISFTGLTAAAAGVTVDNMAAVTFSPQGTAASLTVSSPAANQDKISGTSGASVTPLTFFDDTAMTVDASATTGNDTVSLNGGQVGPPAQVLVASNLQNFTVNTGSGNDRVAITASSFALPASGGTLTVNTGAGDNTLDFTNFSGSLKVSMDKSQITATSDSSVLKQAGTPAQHVDINFLSGARDAVDGVLDKLSNLAGQLQTGAGALSQLTTQLPVLSRATQGSLGQILGFSQKISDFVTGAKNEISILSGAATLSNIVTDLNMLASSLPSGFATVAFTSDYRGAPSDSTSPMDQLEALINVQLTASASATIPIDLGAGAQDVGLTINGSINVNASLTGNLTLGLTTESTPKPFLVPSQTLMPASDLTLSAMTGTGVTATASADTFSAAEVGDEVSFMGGVAVIRTFTDAQHVTVDILSNFSSTSLTSGNWSLSDGLLAGVHASVNPLNASVKVGFLSANISNGSIDFSGVIHIGLTDPDSGKEIIVSELTGSPGNLVKVPTPTSTFSASLPVSVSTGVQVGSVDLLHGNLSLALPPGGNIFSGSVPTFSFLGGPMPATDLMLSATTGTGVTATALTADAFASTDVGAKIFFQGGVAVIRTVTDARDVTVDILNDFSQKNLTSGNWLLGNVNLLDFSNVTPTEVMGMLGGVFNTFVSIAGNSVLKTPIPFTGKTVGDILDYATTFKTKILDPLFVSRNSLSPDPDGDGVPDFNFSSIQELVDRLTTALGLPAGTIKASYDPTSKELTFALSFDRALGFGQATVVEVQHGDQSHDEIQTVTVNALNSGGALDDTYKLAFTDDKGLMEFTDPIAYNAPASGMNSVQSALEKLTGIGSSHVMVTVPDSNSPNVYKIEFIGTKGDQPLPLLVSDASQLAGAFPINFGASLGDFAGLQTKGNFGITAGLSTGLTFGIDLHPSEQVQITPPVYSPAATVTVEATPIDASDNTMQLLTTKNATAGTYVLIYSGSPTGNIKFNDGASTIQSDLNALTEQTSLTLSSASVGTGITATAGVNVFDSTEVGMTISDGTGQATITGFTDAKDVTVDITTAFASNTILSGGNWTLDLHVTVTDMTPSSVGNQHIFSIQFASPIKPALLTAEAGSLMAPVNTGVLSGTANFGVKVRNNASVIVLTTQPAEAMQNTSLTLSALTGMGVTATAGADAFTAADVGLPLIAGTGHAVITAYTSATQVTINIDSDFAFKSITSGNWSIGQSEVQQVTVANATGGTFTLAFNGKKTSPLDFDATDTTVQAALAGPGGIVSTSSGDVAVSKSGSTYTITFQGALTGKDQPELQADSSGLTNTTAADDITVAVSPNGSNMSLADLTKDVQTRVNTVLGMDQLTLGFFTNGDLSTGVLTTSSSAVTGMYNARTSFPNDLAFTLKLMIGGQEKHITGTISLVNLLDTNSDGVLDSTELAGMVSTSTLASKLQTAVNSALMQAGEGGFTVAVGASGSKLTFQVTAAPHTTDSLEFIEQTPIEADGGGGRVSLTTTPVQLTASATEQGLTVNRQLDISAQFSDPAYQELGLLSAPTPLGSHTTPEIDFTLVVNGTPAPVTLASQSVSSIDDLVTKLQAAVDSSLISNGLAPLGFGSTGTIVNGTTFTATSAPFSMFTDDVGFTVVAGGMQIAVTVKKSDANSNLAMALQTAINDALSVKMTGVTVTVGTSGSDLTITPSGGSLEILSPVQVFRVEEAGVVGNRIGFRADPGTVSKLALNVPKFVGSNLNGAISELGFDSGKGATQRAKAIQFFIDNVHLTGKFSIIASGVQATATLGFLSVTATGRGTQGDGLMIGSDEVKLSSTPTTIGLTAPSNGQLVNDAAFSVSDGSVEVAGSLSAAATAKFMSRADLQTAIQKALDGALANLKAAGGMSGTITVSIDNTTGAITLTGTDGFSIRGGGKIVDATADFSLVNPIDGTSKLTPDVLASALSHGKFFFDVTHQGADSNGIPTTGIISGSIAGGVGARLDIAPGGALAGLADTLNAHAALSAISPNWLISPPLISDELGFGTNSIPLSATAVSLSKAAPTNGQLLQNVSFFISDGMGHAGVGLLHASDTSTFSSLDQLVTALRGAVNDALVRLHAAEGMSPSTTTITVGKDSNGNISLTASGSDLSIQGNYVKLDFQGPDFNSILDKFRHLSFSDIISGLKLLVGFLRSLDGSGGGGALAQALAFKLPLINRSISDLVDIAGKVSDRINAIEANPAGSVQQLNDLLVSALGSSVLDQTTTPGNSTTDAVQLITFHNAIGGSFTLSFGKQTTSPILFSADHTAVESALEKLTGITTVSVVKTITGLDYSYQITFLNPGNTAVPQVTGRMNILSLDVSSPSDPILNIDLGIGTGVELARPFDLDLSKAGLPSFLTDLVGVSASGNLDVKAEANFHLDLGFDLGANHKEIFLHTGSSGTALVASASASGDNLAFDAKLGPFGLFVVNGTASLNGGVTISLLDPDTNGRLVIVDFSSNPDVALTLGNTTGKGVMATASADLFLPSDVGRHIYMGTGEAVIKTVTDTTHVTVDILTDFASTTLAAGSWKLQFPSGLSHLGDFVGKDSITVTGEGEANLPLYVGTQDHKVPLDFLSGGGPLGFPSDPTALSTSPLSLGKAAPSNGVLMHDVSFIISDGTHQAVGLLKASDTSGFMSTNQLVMALQGAINDALTKLHMDGSVSTTTITVGTDGGGNITLTASGTDLTIKDNDNALGATLDVVKLIGGTPGAFTFTLPDFDFTNFHVPSIFALLSDPATVVDGLDKLLGTLQQALSGQLFGLKLPFLGDLLAHDPAADFVGDIRTHLLQPLANLLRNNNVNLAGLVNLIKQELVNVLGPGGPFDSFVDPVTGIHGLLKDENGDGKIGTDDIIQTGVDPSNAFDSTSYIQFDFDIGKTFTIMAPPLNFDLGIPALGIQASFQPEIKFSFNLHVGFGVDEKQGFYFVTNPITPLASASINVDFGSTQMSPAEAMGRLLFLALKLTDGVALDPNQPNNLTFSGLNLGGQVILDDPGYKATGTVTGQTATTLTDSSASFTTSGDGLTNDLVIITDGTGKGEQRRIVSNTGTTLTVDKAWDTNPDATSQYEVFVGRLTFAEMHTASFSDIVKPSLSGAADLRVHAMVDFSTLDASLANVLPSVSTDLLVHFGFTAMPKKGFMIDPPSVALANITLDLGSFISQFAEPILGRIKSVLDPLAWLIGPDGFLNKPIPLISQLAGHPVTGKDLVLIFDPEDGPKVVAFLNFVQELYSLANLADSAAQDAKNGGLKLDFGNLVLTDPDNIFQVGTDNFSRIFDGSTIPNITFPSVPDLRSLSNLNGLQLPGNLPTPTFSSPPASTTMSFTSGVQKPGSIDFPILKPATIFKLIMGQPDVTLVTVTLPQFGFNFFYRQAFPIFGPLVATFGGGVGATINLTFGYDTHGLQQFLNDHNPTDLINGFFIDALDPATGQPKPQITFTAQIAVGAAIDLGIASAGVEGGITAVINFALDDLDMDGKVRLNEIAANLLANHFNPIAVFDISGELDFFLRAFLEINLGFFHFRQDFEFAHLTLFQFNITFTRPAILASQSGDTLTLNIGPNAASRLHGDLSPQNETIHVEGDDNNLEVWSDQYGVSETVGTLFEFHGVHKIVATGGGGNELIDLSGVDSSVSATIQAGDGNATVVGGAGNDMLMAGAGNDVIIGNGGNDTIKGGPGTDELFGAYPPPSFPAGFSMPDLSQLKKSPASMGGANLIMAGSGTDLLYGGGVGDTLVAGPGNDTFVRGNGGDTYQLAAFAGTTDLITGTGSGSDVLDFTGATQNLAFILRTNEIDAGFDQMPNTDPTTIGSYRNQLKVDHPTNISTILGGDENDTYHVFGTAAAGVTLNGQKGSNSYVFHMDASDPVIKATVNDAGNPWDSGSNIQVLGTNGPDNIKLTNSTITLDNGQATPQEIVTYVSPAADANILSIKINTGGGDDQVFVASTSATVPVRVETGNGNNVVTVGDPADPLSGIQEQDRPGLNAPFGIGPLVLVGGTGHNAVVFDDSGDSTARSGNLTAFLESRMQQGIPNPVEVGVLSGLGMTLAEPGGPPSDGRVEFEGFKAVNVKLGTAGNTFTVGGNALMSHLPRNRQPNVTGFVSTITGMNIITGGPGSDTIKVVDTNQVDRDTLRVEPANNNLTLLSASTTNLGGQNQFDNAVQQLMVSQEAHGVGYFTIGYRYEETKPIPFGATDAQVEAALVALPLIGQDAAMEDNVSVSKASMNGQDVYTLTFLHDLGGLPIGLGNGLQIVPHVVPFIVAGGSAAAATDTINVQSIRETSFLLGGDGKDVMNLNVDDMGQPLTTNGINAVVTLDGRGGTNTYKVNLIGGTTASLVNVFPSGNTDSLTVNAPLSQPNLFLLRANVATSGLAFIALLNKDATKIAAQQPVERVNYVANLGSIVINGGNMGDKFYMDDTRAKITINGGLGNDFYQIGQLYQTPRVFDPSIPSSTGIAEPDAFATIDTTKGWLSNGISFPMTINGARGQDLFIVFHNLAVLNLYGSVGNDTFIIQAFALVGSQDDKRAITDITGGAGADLIMYAVDAPVNIVGGSGFNTLIVIGTEFNDSFVITDKGIFGAGLSVNFTNIQKVVVDGAEGDNRFFVLGTSPDYSTEIDTGLGSGFVSIGGPTPADGVISENLKGHSGIISHNVTSSDPNSSYNGIDVSGISANIADADEPAVIVNQPDGGPSVVQGGGFDTFTVVLSRPPLYGRTITITASPPSGLVFLDSSLMPMRNGDGSAANLSLTFDASDWYIPQTVRFKVDSMVANIPSVADILMSVVDVLSHKRVSAATGNSLTDLINSFPVPQPTLPEGLRGSLVTITDSTSQPDAVGQTRLIIANTDHTLTLDKPWDHVPPNGAFYDIKLFSRVAIPNVRVKIYSQQHPAIIVHQTEGSTSVSQDPNGTVANTAIDTITVALSQAPQAGETVTINLNGSGLHFLDGSNNPITSLTFDSSNYSTLQTIQVVATVDAIVRGIHQVDLSMAASSTLGNSSAYAGQSQTLTVDVGDINTPGVRILQRSNLANESDSNGSTDLSEFNPAFGVSAATAVAAGFPLEDSYQVVLTKAPALGETVTVNAVADPTRTDRGGGVNGLRSFTRMVVLSTDNVTFGNSVALTFNSSNWDTPQTVYVQAAPDARVEGNDTTVFAPTLHQASAIRGPLIIHGGSGEDRTGLLELEPIMLPGEKNVKASVGSVVSAAEASGGLPATVTINPNDLKSLTSAQLAKLGITITNPALLQPSDLLDLSFQITDGTAKNKVRFITGAVDNGNGTWTLSLNHSWFSPFPAPGNPTVPDNTSRWTMFATNPNLLVDHRDQSSLLQVFDTDNPSSYNDPALPPNTTNPQAVGQLFYDSTFPTGVDQHGQPTFLNMFRITGLGMGGDRVIGGTAQPGGISFDGIQNLDVNLGSGNDHFTISNTPANAVVRLNTGAGDDLVDVKSISGHTFVNLGSGHDTVNVHNDGHNLQDMLGLLTVSGGVPQASVIRLDNGSTAQGASVSHVGDVVSVTVTATGGTFTLTFDGQTTAPLAYNAAAAQVKSALEQLSTVGKGNVFVTSDGNVYTIQFQFDLAGTLGVLSADGSGLTGGTVTTAVNDLQQVILAATGGTFTLSFGGQTTTPLAYNAMASAVQTALQALSTVGAGNLAVSQAGTVYTFRFQGALAGTTQTLGVDDSGLTGDGVNAVDDIQRLTVDATGGTFALSLDGVTTAPLSYAISAADLQTALQGLSNIGAGNVVVTKAGNVYRIEFVKGMGGRPVDLLATHDLDLTNGLGSYHVVNVDDSGSTANTVGVLTSSSLTGLSTQQVDAIQSIFVNASQGHFTLAFGSATTAPLAYNISAADLQTALQGLTGIKPGDVGVSRNDKVIVVRFQGNLAETNVPLLVATPGADLMLAVEQLGGGVNLVPGTVQVSSRVGGSSTPEVNDMQAVTVNATGGTYTLSLLGGQITTTPIPYDASADFVQNALQAAFAVKDPGEQFKIDVTVNRYANVYLIGFQGKLRRLVKGPGVDLLQANTSGLTGTVNIAERVDGLNYYGIENLNIDTSSGNTIFSVQGTTAGSNGFYGAGGVAITNIRFHGGVSSIGQVYVSSNADLDFATATPAFDFLSGNLDDVNGALNLDVGSGRHRLMISNEGTPIGHSPTGPNVDGVGVVITGTPSHLPGGNPAALGLAANAEIFTTGLSGRPDLFPQGGISYRAAPDGNFFDGITYWTGSGDDSILIDEIHRRAGGRTMTVLNTGLGDDHVTVNLKAGPADQGPQGPDFFALNAGGGSQSVNPSSVVGPVRAADTVDASRSTLPLIIFGDFGPDFIRGGQGGNIILGHFGRVQYIDPVTGQMIASVGAGGHGDLSTSQQVAPAWIYSRDYTIGSSDTIRGGAGQDVIIGGAAGNVIDGGPGTPLPDGGPGAGDDLIFGPNVQLRNGFTDTTNPRFEALSGTQIYSTVNQKSQVDTVARVYRGQNPDGSPAPLPWWASYHITILHHTAEIQAAHDNSFGNSYIAGGGGNNVIFGDLGNDTIQGNGSIDSFLAGNPVGAYRDASNALHVAPSFEAPTDGSNYIEGGGGHHTVIFGNGGQNDIIGGSSSLFGLTTPDQRPDGSSIIFAGAATRISRDYQVPTTDPIYPIRHAHNASVIVANNGNIYDLVGTNSTDGGGFLQFNYDQPQSYDNRGPVRIIPRAVDLLDYTPGGPTVNPAANNDIGLASEIHAESGDTTIYGGPGNDIIFGGAGDDDIIGGYGNKWISGGAGNAAIIGSDGRIFRSRNGLAEPLYGIAAIPANQLNQFISTPGKIQQATINVAGAIVSTVDLEPFSEDNTFNASAPEFNGGLTSPHNMDDIIYGGLGNDSIHGGPGDDAISGAEALPYSFLQTEDANGNLTGIHESDWYHPYNPGDALRFNPIDPNTKHPKIANRTGDFALYDEFDPRRKILLNSDGTASKTGSGLPWFLNFITGESAGNSNIFGDLGNNWIVGGTVGTNHLYGGFGNDILDVRASQDIDGGLNDIPNTAALNRDVAFGGAGMDVLIADSSADRLIDWVGNFNSYIVPFAPWGMPTVSRTVQPGLPVFLYALSKSDGADQTRAADTGSDPTRNGEPLGELGLVLQHDAAWHSQTGAPADQPPGNIGGTKRNVTFKTNFTNNSALGFFPDSGTWLVNGSKYEGSAAAGSDAVSLLYLNQWQPSYAEYLVTLKMTGNGAKQDGYLIFDYQNSMDFKYAGIDAKSGLLRIGHRTAAGWVDSATLSYSGSLATNYYFKLVLNAATAQLSLGTTTLSYTFASPLNTGMLGLGADSAVTTFSSVTVQFLPPALVYTLSGNFSSGVATNFTPQSGQWVVANSKYTGTPGTGIAMTTRPLVVAPWSYVQYQSGVNVAASGGIAGLIFGYNSPTQFLFAEIVAGTNQVILGHVTPAGWVTDAVSTRTITPGTTYTLMVAIDQQTVTVVLNGVSVVAYTYNFLPNQGGVGLFTKSIAASFTNLTIRGDDPNAGPLQIAAGGQQAVPASAAPLTQSQLQAMGQAAILRWEASPAFTTTSTSFNGVSFQVVDLPSQELGQTDVNTILIDRTAAGWGWFIDVTPFDDAEFSRQAGNGQLLAGPSSPAYGRMDLETVVMHELGHLLGLQDLDLPAQSSQLMATWLRAGVRRLPNGLMSSLAIGRISNPSTLINGLEIHPSSGAAQGGAYIYSGDVVLSLRRTAIWENSQIYPPQVRGTGGSYDSFAFNRLPILNDTAVDYLYGKLGQDWFWSVGPINVANRSEAGSLWETIDGRWWEAPE